MTVINARLFREVVKIRRFLNTAATDVTFPTEIRGQANNILKTLEARTHEISSLITTVEDSRATLADRQSALSLLGDIVKRIGK